VKSGELTGFMDNVRKTDANWIGFSLTMPLKEEVFKVADRVNPLAKQINSANTLIPTLDGWFATSTDVAGFIWALAQHEIANYKSVTIIGAGGTARAAAAAIDAPGVKIQVITRNPGGEIDMRRAVNLADISFIPWEKSNLDADLVINTTPKGAADLLPKGTGVLFESLYDPWPTQLASGWGGKVIDGMDLLIHQAIDQIHLMTGFVIDRKLMYPLLRAAGEAEIKDSIAVKYFLILVVALATYFDLKSRRIPNWLTYSAFAISLIKPSYFHLVVILFSLFAAIFLVNI
jgi:shikimate dehydrogenase